MKVSVVAGTAVKSPASAVSELSIEVATPTVTVWPLAADSVTANSAGSPSVASASATLTDGGSSSSSMVMVERVWSPAVAFSKS